MNQIFKKVRDVDPNNSDAVKDVLSTFFQNLTKHADADSFRWLRTLENVVNRFPKYCGSHRNTIETYLVNFIDSTSYFNVIEAAKCAHVLQQVRPPQEKTATAKVSWRDHLIVLCNVAHKLIAELFPNTVDMYKGGENRQKPQLQSTATSPLYTTFTQLKSSKAPNNNVKKQYLLSTKLKNVLIFLQAALVEVYPVAKPVQPQIVLEVIVRVLSVSSGTKTNLDVSTIAAIKIQALKTLDALVACLGPNLIPFSALVFRVVTQTLRWSSDNPNEDSGKVRVAAYLSGAKALGQFRGRAGDAEPELAAQVARDVAPARQQITLTINSQPNSKNLSKKARRKLANTMLQESSIAAHTPGEKNKAPLSEEMNDEVAIAALDFTETLLTVSGIFLKPATHKLLQELVVRECYALERYSVERALGLLRALDALRKAGPAAPPPTHHCLQLYSALLNSTHREIAKFSSQALLDMRLHLHCSPPSLNFALEPPEKQKAPEKRKKVSDRNRAALAALLGDDRIPVEDSGDELIIDISDEPSRKKVCVDKHTMDSDAVMDKISLSSESMDSVVIQDDVTTPDEELSFEVSACIENINNEHSHIEDEIEEITNETIEAVQSEQSAVQSASEPEVVALPVNKDGNDKDEDIVLMNGITKISSAVDETDTIVSTQTLSSNIHEATTQMPLDTVDGDRSPISLEVAYDFPNTGKDKVTVLERVEDENLPSTNDTDDIQITCGQVVKSSQDNEVEKNKQNGAIENTEIKVNGNSTPEKTVEALESVMDKTSSVQDINVDDMLADFVDEVIEENKISA